uniref:Eukaryotic translation initiation factor 3 subunit E n=1 Tax=Aplanochytrium stocchinoi TaxID=215587 RepID=A0A7S3PJJ9_9STRA|mmetsp:Transcript_5292/g.6238  ORF Transcript_5292/g.6238 Transcript_5292/m.6238 type:complete len:479 (+) Transcript_5292:59-1495(+)
MAQETEKTLQLTEVVPVAKYDLTRTIAPYLDLHMMFPLIQFLEEKAFYKQEDLTNVLVDFLRPTNMHDYTLEILGNLGEVDSAVEEELIQRRDETVHYLNELEESCAPLLDILRNEETLNQLITEENFTLEYLEQAYGINVDVVDSFYRYGKCTYDCGNYQEVIFIMYYYRLLVGENTDYSFNALWGKLAAEILMLQTNDNVANALKDAQRLQQMIDERDELGVRNPGHHLEQLQLRSWLLHWSIFIFFKNPMEEEPEESKTEGLEVPAAADMPVYLMTQMIEFFISQKYLNALQTNCPWLLRYLTAAVIISKARRRTLRLLVNVIRQEQYTYRDPITEFIECLCVKFDFEAAQEKLLECEKVLVGDYFLQGFQETFMNNARLFIFETYCRIHTKIDTKMLSAKLNMGNEDAERWIVNLIREAKLDAKIDSEQGHVIMGKRHASSYQQTIDKTKDLTYRSYQLVNNVLNMHNEQKQQQ